MQKIKGLLSHATKYCSKLFLTIVLWPLHFHFYAWKKGLCNVLTKPQEMNVFQPLKAGSASPATASESRLAILGLPSDTVMHSFPCAQGPC